VIARHRRQNGFSLLEVIVALGVLAIGASAAFALLVAAASAGRRAEHHVNAALLAETILNDIKGELDESFDLSTFPLASTADPIEGLEPDPNRPEPSDETRYLVRNRKSQAYPGYTYDIAITPLPSPVPDLPWHFLVEVEVRWSNRGQRRSAVYATVMLRRIGHMANPVPKRP
jgi:prepilin-type N-terminal cleavage/methylation domain-containing protein